MDKRNIILKFICDNEKKYAEIHLRTEKASERELIDSKMKLNSEKY